MTCMINDIYVEKINAERIYIYCKNNEVKSNNSGTIKILKAEHIKILHPPNHNKVENKRTKHIRNRKHNNKLENDKSLNTSSIQDEVGHPL